MKFILLLLTISAASIFAKPTKEPLKFSDSKDTKKILFIAGKPSHGHGQHEHRAGCILLADALNKSKLGMEAKVHWYGWPENQQIFERVDLTVVYADAAGRMNENIQTLIDTRVSKGMGIMFIHYGVHPTKEVGDKYFLKWTGAYYGNDSVNPHWIANITPLKNHPVSYGIKEPFKAFDEFYFNMVKKTECQHCLELAKATPKQEVILRYNNHWSKIGESNLGKEQALMWARDPGKGMGRGVGWVGGHFHSNWAMNDFRKLTLNAIAWAAKVAVPKDGVPSTDVTIEMLNANLDAKNPPFQILPPGKDIFTRKAQDPPVTEPKYRSTRRNGLLSPMWKKGDKSERKRRAKNKKKNKVLLKN